MYFKMQEQLELNSKLIRAYLKDGDRKQSHLVKELGVSTAQVGRMLGGYIPNEDTVERLALLIGCQVKDLLIPKEAKTA